MALSTLHGVDISEYQKQVDFDVLKQNKDFCIIRSSFGTVRMDNEFQRNRAEARRVGLLYGIYHYAYPQYNTPEAEAEFFFQTLGSVQEGEILFLDFEESFQMDHASWCKSFLDHLSYLTNGYKGIVYLNLSEIISHNWQAVREGNYGLWEAHYDENPQPSDNLPWEVIAFKQYSNNEIVPGIIGKVDADVFFGDRIAFEAYGYHAPVAPTPPTPIDPCQQQRDEYQALLEEFNKYKIAHPISFIVSPNQPTSAGRIPSASTLPSIPSNTPLPLKKGAQTFLQWLQSLLM